MKRVILNMAAVLGIAVLALCMTQPANAAAITIDFSGSSGGTVTLNLGGVASSSNVAITQLSFDAGPQMNISALLSFNSSAGTLSITSTAPITIGANPAIPTGTLLLNGTGDTFKVTNGGSVLTVQATGPDTKNATLLADLGVPAGTTFGLTAFSLSANPVVGGNGTTWTASSTDILNVSTPEPGTLVMFGSGLLGLAGIIRRKLSV